MGEIKIGRIGVKPPCLLLKTGQTTQYNSKEDDGYFEKGVSRKYVVLDSGPYADTVDIVLNAKTHALSNNCVIDKRTGLMWARYVPDADIGPDNDGKLLGVDDTNNEDIYDFKDQADTKELGGHSDWRVPNILELFSLLKWDKGSTPAIDETAFPDTPSSWHYTSTAYGISNTEVLNFVHPPGIAYGVRTTAKYYCRLVRGPLGGEI